MVYNTCMGIAQRNTEKMNNNISPRGILWDIINISVTLILYRLYSLPQIFDMENTDPHVVGVRNFNEHVKQDKRVNISFLILGDGLTLLFKK